ncbi:ABC-2 transporter permease [Thermoanaerobacter wiegelii]|uniref:ABC-2 transporter permease n=1 Tax=Thermoanaerobacter wiegelii Rt8.B1 TaxID=697303 RepID=G2MU02_9THEO|nr:ABC-2 transporter permease [Thermoanaerobacter wiegelii]AEM79829.1 hypothetical protein Thewi_2502 [Thermoanaerobacter wiegelii Rt8.B1]
MFSLILKDILISKKILLLTAAFLMVWVPTFRNFAAVGIMAGMTYMGMIIASSADETNKADILLNSLPLRRHEIVLAKYLSIFVYSAIGIAIYLLVAAATKVLGFPIHVYPINFKAVIYGILAVSFLNGIYLPLMFKFGHGFSGIMYIILIFGFSYGISYVIRLFGKYDWFQNIVSFIMNQSDTAKMLFITALALIILTVSCLLSVKFYKNREF